MSLKHQLIGKVHALLGTNEILALLRSIDAHLAQLTHAAVAPSAHPPVEKFTQTFAHLIQSSAEDSWFSVRLNDHRCWLPRNTLLTMTHCAHPSEHGAADLWVETAHLQWMLSKLRPGAIFLDVGAATGAMTLPIALQFNGKVEIMAFEPARKARHLLTATVERNRLAGVKIVDAAIANETGETLFSEYPADETGQTPFLPETSAIHSPMIDLSRAQQYQVKMLTLDGVYRELNPGNKLFVVKIDVEGFEIAVLKGARNFIHSARPWLAIDIHVDPFDQGSTTEPFVRSFLAEFGYSVDKSGHVILCSPA